MLNFVAPILAIVALFAIERVILRRRPLWLAPLAIRLGKEQRVPIDDVTRSSLVRLDADDESYRAPAIARTDWSALDAAEVRVWLSDSEVTVDLDAARGLLVVRPRTTLGRNRGVWASFLSLERGAGELVLRQRFYLGDVLWPFVLGAAGHERSSVIIMSTAVVLMYLPMRVASTYYQLQSLPKDLATRLEKCLATDDRTHLPSAAATTPENEEDRDEPNAAGRARRGP